MLHHNYNPHCIIISVPWKNILDNNSATRRRLNFNSFLCLFGPCTRLFIIFCIFFIPFPFGLEVISTVYPECNNSGQNIPRVCSQVTSDICLNLLPLKVGTQIPLHSLIEMPSLNEDAFLSIEFPRSALEDQFVKDMFYRLDYDIIGAHPFSSNGIEPVLTRDKLILNIHSGVILHLRNDMILSPTYKTFRNEKIKGVVEEVRGNVLWSCEHSLIKEKLENMFVMFQHAHIDLLNPKPGTKIIKNPDGSTSIIAPGGLKDMGIPPKYFPRIIEDQEL